MKTKCKCTRSKKQAVLAAWPGIIPDGKSLLFFLANFVKVHITPQGALNCVPPVGVLAMQIRILTVYERKLNEGG